MQDMDAGTSGLTGEQSPSLTDTELRITQLWSEVLPSSTGQLTAADNFFVLGGDSMGMVMVEYRIKEEFLVELDAGTLLVAPTVRELSAAVDAALGEARDA